jgi:hypothetical protein
MAISRSGCVNLHAASGAFLVVRLICSGTGITDGLQINRETSGKHPGHLTWPMMGEF